MLRFIYEYKQFHYLFTWLDYSSLFLFLLICYIPLCYYSSLLSKVAATSTASRLLKFFKGRENIDVNDANVVYGINNITEVKLIYSQQTFLFLVVVCHSRPNYEQEIKAP